MHKHVVVVIQSNDAGRAFEIADKIAGFKRTGSKVIFRKGHFIIAGTQTEAIVPISPVMSVQADIDIAEVECCGECASVN